MRKPPIFLDKPIAGAIIRQTDRPTDRQTESVKSVHFLPRKISSRTNRAHCVRGFSTDVVRFFACAERAEGR